MLKGTFSSQNPQKMKTSYNECTAIKTKATPMMTMLSGKEQCPLERSPVV